jgi:hypothetical protein
MLSVIQGSIAGFARRANRRGDVEPEQPVSVIESTDRYAVRETITERALKAVRSSSAVIVLDAKGDRTTREKLAKAARAGGRTFFEVTPRQADRYRIHWDRLSIQQLVAIATPPGEAGSPHPRAVAVRYISQVVGALRMCGIEPNLHELAHYCDPLNQHELLGKLNKSPLFDEVARRLSWPHGTDGRSVASYVNYLRLVTMFDGGQLFGHSTTGSPGWDLVDAVKEHAVVYVNLERHDFPILADALARMITQDLLSVVRTLQGCKVPSLVAITRFSGITASQLRPLIARGRSASMTLLLAEQSLAPQIV